MRFSKEDRRRLREFYDPAIEQYGYEDVRSLRWSEYQGQQERFRVLSEVGVRDGASVLDVGCGFGDLYHYLSERYSGISYLGIDINSMMIDAARQKYPAAQFIAADFGSWFLDSPPENKEQYDFALASGTFSFKIGQYRDVYLGYIRDMFRLCRIATAFNMLDARYHIDDDTYATYWPDEIEAYCRGLTPNVEVRTKYLRQDFTIYMHR